MSLKLKKTLGLVDVFCIAVGAMISAGIFLLPGVAFKHIGPAIIFSYIVGGLLATLGILAVLELATAMPRAGGIYYFTTRSLGPLAGTISGVLNWSALSLKSAFAIYGMSQIIHIYVPSINPVWCGVFITIFFLIINLLSTAAAAWAERVMVFFLLAIMVAYGFFGLPHVQTEWLKTMFIEGKNVIDIFKEAGFIFVAFGGLLGVISVAEEVRQPGRSLPLGILWGLVVVTILYGLLMYVTIGVVPAEELKVSKEPLAQAAKMYYGGWGYWILTLGAMLAFVTTGNAGIMGAARYPVALARDGLMPKRFSSVMGKNAIPVPALLLTGGFMVAVQFMGLETLVKVASTVVILSYILTNAAVLILRESGVLNYRPSFRTPLYPVVPFMSILLFSLLILRMDDISIYLSLLIITGSVILYYIYGRKVRRDTAFTHLLGRLTQNEIVTSELERELRDIVRSRDEIVTDVFDEAVEKSPALVLKNCRSVRELFGIAADQFAQHTQLSARELHSLLIKRERMASTIIAPGVAVPHITLPSEKNLFAMLIVKVEKGVNFTRDALPVETAVFLICSPDEKNRHIHSLAMIAQAILDPDFNKRWKKAYSSQQIKDIFLLAKRIRANG